MICKSLVAAAAVLLLARSGMAQSSSSAPARFTPQEKRQGFSDRRVLAKPRAATSAGELAVWETQGGRQVRHSFPKLGNLRVIETAAGESIRHTIEQLRASGRYEFVEPDYIKTRCALPDDPRFTSGELWHLRNTGQNGGVAGADIGAVAAWDVRTDASSVIVAVIDTGVRVTHEDLAANLWTNPHEILGNGIDDDHNGYVDDVHGNNTLAAAGSAGSGNPDDDFGHGTAVASGSVARRSRLIEPR